MGMETEREVWKEPIGVVGVIVPWNFPFEIILNKLGPILAMGNTCVLKPAPDTPWNATRLGRLIAEKTDIPPGVVNIVVSQDHLVGEVLTTSPAVDMVAFTGSTATGRRIMAAAADTLKPVVPGARRQVDQPGARRRRHRRPAPRRRRGLLPRRPGLRHADPPAGAPLALRRGGRRRRRRASPRVPYGDPTDASTTSWARSSRASSSERVLGYIEKGKAEGARLVCGGGVPAQFEKGYFVEPTLFADVDNSMTIAQEEIFGPVLVMIAYEDDDDAVRIANDSPYGLSGTITSGDLDRAKAVARRIRTGTLGLNGGVWYGADAPFGGYKQSGIGRQCGLEGLEIYTETKTVGWPGGRRTSEEPTCPDHSTASG